MKIKILCPATAFAAGLVLVGMPSSLAQLAAPAPATTAAASGTAAKIVFDSTTYNFGKANAGELVRHDFIFTNTGNAVLEITEVRPGCGCTTAGAWDKSVEPGKTGSIPLQFNSSGFSGTVTKSATVTCNDPKAPSHTLQITGAVWKPIEVTPAMASFIYQSDDQTNETKVLRILNHTDEPITLSDVKCANPSFQTELKTVTPGKEFELHITAVPPFTKASAFASISIKTSSLKTPTLNMSAYVQVQQQVMLMPEQIVLPPGPLTNVVNLTINVKNNASNALALSDVRLDLPGAKVVVQEMQPGRLFALRASFPAGFDLKPDQKGELTAKSDNPKFPLLKVPVYHSAGLSPLGPIRQPRATITNALAAPGLVPGRAPLPPAPKN